MDMAQQFEALQAEVVGIIGRLSELEEALDGDLRGANAVILDWQFADGKSEDLIARLDQRELAIVVCSGYGEEECPAHLSHIPWVTKPANGELVAQRLCEALDARMARQA